MTNRERAAQIFADPAALATPLFVLLVDTYGYEPLGQDPDDKDETWDPWDPETLHLEISDDFKIQLPSINLDKLVMAIMVVTTDRFFHSLEDFIHVCNVFSGSAFDPRFFDPADAAECAWGITEAALLSPPGQKEEFTQEIRAYIGKAVSEEGILNPPDILRLGLPDPDRSETSFFDNPELHQQIWQNQSKRTDDLRQMIKSRLQLLVRQISSLPVSQGDTSQLVARIVGTVTKGVGNERHQDKTPQGN